MSAHQKAIRVVTFPFRAVWFLILIANFLVVSAFCVLFAAFIAYALELTISYLVLPTEWTRALWDWAANLYLQSNWFKAAIITLFLLLLLPILKLWPGRDPQVDEARDRESTRLNDDLIAARQQEQLRAKLRG